MRKVKLTPINKEDFDRLPFSERGYSKQTIAEFLSGTDDIAEVDIPNVKPAVLYSVFIKCLRNYNFPAICRKRGNRVFLLKRHSHPNKGANTKPFHKHICPHIVGCLQQIDIDRFDFCMGK